MPARDASGQILPPLIIGLALVAGGIMTHIALAQALRPAAGDFMLFLITAPGAALVGYAAFLSYFLRDPERETGPGWVSPADGKVLFVKPHQDADIGPGHHVAIFMSPFDVHVNRVPTAATLEQLTHRPGGNRPAFSKESEHNERLVTTWRCHDNASGGPDTARRFKLIQNAGSVARRIVPWVAPGDAAQAGERYGIIKLGSRVDVYLPPGATPTVQAGQRVRAGASTIANDDPPGTTAPARPGPAQRVSTD